MAKEKVAAVVTVHHVAMMTPKGRKAVASWLRRQAYFVERFGPDLAPRFRARYLYR